MTHRRAFFISLCGVILAAAFYVRVDEPNDLIERYQVAFGGLALIFAVGLFQSAIHMWAGRGDQVVRRGVWARAARRTEASRRMPAPSPGRVGTARPEKPLGAGLSWRRIAMALAIIWLACAAAWVLLRLLGVS